MSIRRTSLTAATALLAAGVLLGAEPAAAPEILVSRQLLQARGLAVGQIVRLATAPDGSDAREFRIAGSYEPLPNPFILAEKRYEARLHLPDLAELRNGSRDPLAAESVSRINIALRDAADADAFSADLAARVPGVLVVPARAGGSGADPFAVLERFHFAIAVITLAGSSAFLLALMVMRAEQRRETAGILRLIGLTRRRILLEGFVEGGCVALAGAVFGVILALALEGAFNRFFQWYYDTALVFVAVSPGIVLLSLALALPLGTIAGLAASWTLLRREILELLRR